MSDYRYHDTLLNASYEGAFDYIAGSMLFELGVELGYYGFVLTPPRSPLEALENVREQRASILEGELTRLGERVTS